MPISLLLDKEIGERKRAKGLVSEIHRLAPLDPLCHHRFKDDGGDVAILTETPEHP